MTGTPQSRKRRGRDTELLAALPLLILTESAPEGNPVASMLRELFESGRCHGPTLEQVAHQFNPNWSEWVFRDEEKPR